MYGGKTVENGNTDAEGRLVLADALARSNEDHPDLVVDVATLTGACIIALGHRMSGLMASDDETAEPQAMVARGPDSTRCPNVETDAAPSESKVLTSIIPTVPG